MRADAEPSAAEPRSGSGALPAAGKLPGDPGVWLFIIADMAMFGLFFLIFTLGRAADPALYEQSRQALDPRFGLANTLILLTSGWLMVQAVHAAGRGDRPRTIRFLALTMLVGSGFAVTKVFEYWIKIDAGISIYTNDFFMYYFAFTAIHFIHFLIGIAALGMMLGMAKGAPLGVRYRLWIESVAAYWHMIDLLWVMLFPMLYLQRAA